MIVCGCHRDTFPWTHLFVASWVDGLAFLSFLPFLLFLEIESRFVVPLGVILRDAECKLGCVSSLLPVGI